MSIPDHWTRTSRKPVMIDNYEWLSYRTGINRYALHCVQIDAIVQANYGLTGYNVSIAGVAIKTGHGISGKAKRFTSERTAARDAIKQFNSAAV